jgi:hypothetical protein
MTAALPRPHETANAPEAFRNALAELVQIGMTVARMVGRIAEAETALAEAASQFGAAEGVSALADSLAEAIEADRAAAAAAEARHAVAARTDAVAGAFARVSRAIRLTVLLAERLDRSWARRGLADDRLAMARRQIARGVEDAIERSAEGERAERLTEALTDRLESLDVETEIGNRPAEEIIREICRDLGLDPKRMPRRAPQWNAVRDPARPAETEIAAPPAGGRRGWKPCPPPRRPDG